MSCKRVGPVQWESSFVCFFFGVFFLPLDKSGGNVCGCGIIHSQEDDKRGWPDTFVMEGERWSCTGARRLTDAERSAADKELGCPRQ